MGWNRTHNIAAAIGRDCGMQTVGVAESETEGLLPGADERGSIVGAREEHKMRLRSNGRVS